MTPLAAIALRSRPFLEIRTALQNHSRRLLKSYKVGNGG